MDESAVFRPLTKRLANIAVVRIWFTAALLFALACAVAQQPAQWTPGEVIEIERHAKGYDYSVFSGRCRFVGRTTKKLNIKVGDETKFRLSGKLMLILDRTGKTQRTQFREQWLLPPPPPPVPKAEK